MASHRRPSARKRGYDSRWDAYRARYLREHPLCVRCQRAGRIVPATVVDHIEPHRGDHRLFWDPSNHQSLCAHCHNSEKQRAEKGREFYKGAGMDGFPLDPDHPWNAPVHTHE